MVNEHKLREAVKRLRKDLFQDDLDNGYVEIKMLEILKEALKDCVILTKGSVIFSCGFQGPAPITTIEEQEDGKVAVGITYTMVSNNSNNEFFFLVQGEES